MIICIFQDGSESESDLTDLTESDTEAVTRKRKVLSLSSEALSLFDERTARLH
jgi:hypothetical protein